MENSDFYRWKYLDGFMDVNVKCNEHNKNLKNAEYNFVKFILYEAGGTTNELDTQTF